MSDTDVSDLLEETRKLCKLLDEACEIAKRHMFPIDRLHAVDSKGFVSAVVMIDSNALVKDHARVDELVKLAKP